MLITCMLFFMACKQEKPADIPPPKMELILTDLHLAETYSSMVSDSLHRVNEKNIDSLAVYYNDILKHHNVSKEEFKSSLEWYRNNPSELDTVYGHMIQDMIIVDAKYPKK